MAYLDLLDLWGSLWINTTRDKTGDEAPLGVLFGGLGIGAAGLAVLLEERRRRGRRQ